jgi:hypothetical protein
MLDWICGLLFIAGAMAGSEVVQRIRQRKGRVRVPLTATVVLLALSALAFWASVAGAQ